MDDEVILAAILLAAAGLLLILTIIMLCIIVNTAKSRSRKDTSRSEIPNSSHQYGNSGFQRENGVSMHENIPGNTATRVSHNDEYKAEWPTSYNMYAVSRSYAFPKAGDHSEQSSELGSKAQPSNPPSTLASRSSTLITREVHHKTFSEEVFEGINQDAINYTTATTLSRSAETNDSRVWKTRTPSETASLHSRDTNSVRGSVATSRDYRVLTEKNSYYSSFKPRNSSVSTETTSQVVEMSTNSGITREKLTTHSIKTSGSTKVFSFDLK